MSITPEAAEVRSSGSRSTLALTLAAGLIGGAVGALVAIALTTGQPVPPPVAPPRIEPAQRSRLELVDAAGKPRLILNVAPSGAAGITMLDANGKERLGMDVGADGEPRLVLLGGTVILDGAVLACMRAPAGFSATLDADGLLLFDQVGDANLGVRLTAKGGPLIAMKESGTKRGVNVVPSGLSLKAADGETGAFLTAEIKGTAMLQLGKDTPSVVLATSLDGGPTLGLFQSATRGKVIKP